jgi:diguanylate cyclase (GGDEF)-like protein/PAS domain S-box-containing protein
MNYYTILTFLAFGANLVLGFSVIFRDPKSRLNKIYSVLAFSITYWAIMKMNLTIAESKDIAILFYKISAPGWCLLPALFIHFTSSFTGRRIFGGVKYGIEIVYFVSLLFAGYVWIPDAMLRDMVLREWGFTHCPGFVYTYVFTPFFILLFLYGIYQLIAFMLMTISTAEKIKALFVIGGTTIPFVFGSITNMILPSMGIHVTELALPLTTINAAIIAFAIVKYNFLSITLEYAASTIIKTMGDSLVVLDTDGRVSLVNPATCDLLNYGSSDIIGLRLNDVIESDILSEDFRSKLEQERIAKIEVNYIDYRQKPIPMNLSISPLKNEKGTTMGYVCVGKDIRELKDLIKKIEDTKKELEALAITDSLTGIYNKRYLLLKLNEEFLRSKRYKCHFSVLISDLDRFKELNDTNGHFEGDLVLNLIAQDMKSRVRESDILARYGGDEYVVLLPETNKENAILTGERLRKNLGRKFLPEKYSYVTASFGVSTFNPNRQPNSPEELLLLADGALYNAKRHGRNRVAHADDRDFI